MSILSVIHLIISSGLLLYVLSNDEVRNRDIFTRFSEYMYQFNKSYEVGTKEYQIRKSIFEETLHRVDLLNKQRKCSQGALYGINQFSDLTPEEFQNYVHLQKASTKTNKVNTAKNKLLQLSQNVKDLPKRVDWREKKIITPVNNQNLCGACWAFSTVETIESMYAKKTGVLEQFSVQQVVDCAASPNKGCSGGDTCLVVEWLYESGTKILLDKDYPFVGLTQDCNENVKSDKTVQIAKNFTCDSFVGEEYLILLHIAHHGPLIAAVDATGWQDYLGGIVEYNCDNERNHAVQIVGYDIAGEIPYYIVRNSWGTDFGNNGYLNIIIGENMCRIAEEVSAVDVI